MFQTAAEPLPRSFLCIRKIFLFPVRIYKLFISPHLPSACNFYPTCSEYFFSAVMKYGVVKGGLMGLKRILRCHPFSRGGLDPVP